MSDAFQKELGFLGIASSPAFVRAPEGNGCAERFIRTLKENLLWVRTFDTVEELRQARLDFRESYNTTWLIERHGFQTPAAVRQNQLSTAARAAYHQSGVSQTGGATVTAWAERKNACAAAMSRCSLNSTSTRFPFRSMAR